MLCFYKTQSKIITWKTTHDSCRRRCIDWNNLDCCTTDRWETVCDWSIPDQHGSSSSIEQTNSSSAMTYRYRYSHKAINDACHTTQSIVATQPRQSNPCRVRLLLHGWDKLYCIPTCNDSVRSVSLDNFKDDQSCDSLPQLSYRASR